MSHNVPYVTQDIGDPITLTPADPAPGAEWSYTVPPYQLYHLHTINFRLECSVALNIRQPTFIIYDPAGTGYFHRIRFWNMFSLEARNFSLTLGGPQLINGDEYRTQYALASLPDLYLQPGWIFASNCTGLNAADQYNELRFTITRYICDLP